MPCLVSDDNLIDVPGPRSRSVIKQLHCFFDSRAIHFVVDYAASHGNYIVDIDGNKYLDVYSQIASIPVGYNNENLIKAAKSEQMISALVNRPALGNFPSSDWMPQLKEGLLRIAPKRHNQVFTAQSGSEANELAYKAAFMLYRRRERGLDAEWTQQEIESCMDNAAPGSPELAVLSFRNSFHGRGFGSLSTTRAKPFHKMDIPAFKWPQADFPALRYPLDRFTEENKLEEMSCLRKVEEVIDSWHCSVAAIVVEPIQSEGGDKHASPYFFQQLRLITARRNIVLIVDEVQTGFGATGKFWAHEHWNLSSPPDIVTFSKKAQTAGYFFGDSLLCPDKAYRQFNTWIGDPARVVLCNAIIDEILQKDLVAQSAEVGKELYQAMEGLASKYPDTIKNLRGRGYGTYIAFDIPDAAAFTKAMKQNGVNIGTCGVNTVRLRPMLIFEVAMITILVDRMGRVLQNM